MPTPEQIQEFEKNYAKLMKQVTAGESIAKLESLIDALTNEVSLETFKQKNTVRGSSVIEAAKYREFKGETKEDKENAREITKILIMHDVTAVSPHRVQEIYEDVVQHTKGERPPARGRGYGIDPEPKHTATTDQIKNGFRRSFKKI